MGHELKYGFTYRETGVDSQSAWPGNGNYGDLPDFGEPVAAMTRRGSRKLSVVAYSTTNRAGRSLRLQMIARPPLTSPAPTPFGIAGLAV